MQALTRLVAAAGFGALVILAGCGELSPSNAPVDCDAVKNQEQAGLADAKIASNLGTTVDKVAACRGPKTAVGPQD